MKHKNKGRQLLLAGSLGLALLAGCRPEASKKTDTATSPAMHATIHRQHLYQDIPSGSGMELAGGKLYLIGDDSPFLYVLDTASLRQTASIRLFASDDFQSGRIPKMRKPDLECLTLLPLNGVNTLVAFGSGSTDQRNRCFTIALPAGPQARPRVQEHSLQRLYAALQADQNLLGKETLNLEAAATTPDHLLLLQRAAQEGPNLVLAFPRKEFAAYLEGRRRELPGYTALPFHLPELGGQAARFSGATVFGRRLFFTASVENTGDAIQDGEVLGSFIGWLNLDSLKPAAQPLKAATALVQSQDGTPYKGKVESLVILDSPRAGSFRALAITDNDQGQSELLELALDTGTAEN
ncbi:MAG: DUF6929 family protein [Adhaeribacter sp.]